MQNKYTIKMFPACSAGFRQYLPVIFMNRFRNMQKSRRTVWRQVFSVWKNIHTAARSEKLADMQTAVTVN